MTDVGKVQTRISDRSVGGQDQILPFLQRELSPMTNEIRSRLNDLIDALVAVPSDEKTVTDNAEDVDVANVAVLRLANTSATTLKRLTGGQNLQTVTLYADNGNTTVQNASGIPGIDPADRFDLSGFDFAMATRNTLLVQLIGGSWRELSRKT